MRPRVWRGPLAAVAAAVAALPPRRRHPASPTHAAKTEDAARHRLGGRRWDVLFSSLLIEVMTQLAPAAG